MPPNPKEPKDDEFSNGLHLRTQSFKKGEGDRTQQASEGGGENGDNWEIGFNHVEFLNALSMVVPSLVSMYVGESCSEEQYCRFLYLHCMIHLPFSFGFHSYHIFRPMTSEGMSLVLRKLDNILIHVASIMICYANSRSEVYAGLAALPNIYYILKIIEDGRKPRLDGMALAILTYTCPMIYHGQICLWGWTILGFAVSFAIFIKKIFAPVHHPLMHVVLAWPQYTMLLGNLAVFAKVSG